MSKDYIKKPGETIFGFLFVGMSLFLFWQSYLISGFSKLSSPGAFPLAATALMVLTSCISLLKGMSHKKGDAGIAPFFQQILPFIVAAMIGMLLLFAVMLKTVGFILTAFVFLIASMYFLHRGGIFRSVLLATLALTLIYIIFRLVFKVILPEGIIPEREIMAWIGNFFSKGGQ